MVISIGVLLLGLHVLHALKEIGESLDAIVYGVGLPVLVSLFIIGAGYRLTNRDWEQTSSWRVVSWCGAGMAVLVLFALLMGRYQAAHGVHLEDVFFVLGIHATYGTAIGLVLAEYDFRISDTTRRLRHKTQRLDDFASIVSHDLRNPLNVAQGHVELARETGDLSRLDTVQEAHRRMETIIRDTLALARQGEDALTLEVVDLGAAATEAWNLVESGDAELEVSTERRIRADRSRLKSLFQNVFQNAIEHNTGPLTVRVGTLEPDAGFYVSDTGEGISPELRERVFEAGFTTADHGHGLGFAIIRAVAKAHGWSLTLTESEHGGACLEISDVETSK